MRIAPSGSTSSRVRAVALRPVENLRVAVSLVERRRGSGPSRARSKDGGRFRLIALIEEASVIERILRHLRLPTEVPTPPPLVVELLERQALARPRHSAPAPPRDGGAASGAGTAPRRCSGRPERGRRAPPLETDLFNQDKDVAGFNSCA